MGDVSAGGNDDAVLLPANNSTARFFLEQPTRFGCWSAERKKLVMQSRGMYPSSTLLALSTMLMMAGAYLVGPSYMEWYFTFFDNHWGWSYVGYRWIPISLGFAINALVVGVGMFLGWLFFLAYAERRIRKPVLAGLWLSAILGGSATIMAVTPLLLTVVIVFTMD